jgi:hypothetical protein
MVNHTCEICNYTTKNTTDLVRHKNSKKHMINIEKHNSFNESEKIKKDPKKDPKKKIICKIEEIKCNKCGKQFTEKTNLYRHQKHRCKKNNKISENNENLKKQIEDLQKENEELKKQLEIKKNIEKKIIPKSVKIAAWNDNFGKQCGEHECYIGCGNFIYQGNFECGHVIAKSKGGLPHVNNLKPICSQCNKSMQTQNLEDYKKNQ